GWRPRLERGGMDSKKILAGAGIPKWTHIKNPMERQFRRNSYRVLLTRARQGMVIFIPKGDVLDPTRDPAEFDRTAEFLFSCGVLPLDPAASMTTNEASSNLTPALVL